MPRKRGFRFLIKNLCVLILFTVPGAVSGPPPPCLLWPPGGGQRIPAGQAGMAHSTHPSERFIFRLVYVIYSVSTPRWLGRKANLFQLFPLFKKKNIIISRIIQIFFSSLIRRIPSLPWSVTWGEKSDSNPQYHSTASAVWRASNEPPHFHESWYLRNRLIVHKINFNSKSLFVVQYVKYVKKNWTSWLIPDGWGITCPGFDSGMSLGALLDHCVILLIAG